MASVLMAWVWIGVSLARLNNAESHLYEHGHPTSQDKLHDGNKQLADVAAGLRNLLVPVWNFLQGQTYYCSLFSKCEVLVTLMKLVH